MHVLPYMVLMRLHTAAINARRRSAHWRYLAYSVAAGLVASAMLTIGITLVITMAVVGLWWLGAIVGVFMLIPVIAPLVTRHLWVPLGWVRLAYFGGLWSRPGDDADAYGLCCAAWALGRRPSATGEAWLVAKRDARRPLGDGEVVATALMTADRAAARGLLRSVLWLVEDHPAVRDLAGEWLAVDAAARAAWRELYDLAHTAKWPATSLSFLLEGIAARRVGAAGAPSQLELWARWIVAPHRRVTFRLVRDPQRPNATPAPTPASDSAPHADGPSAIIDPGAPHLLPAPDPLAVAVARHVALANDELSQARLGDAVIAWDAALTSATTHNWLARRALELDAPLGAVDRALREVASAVSDELGSRAELARLAAPTSPGPVGAALLRRLRHGRLDALEQAFTRWERRRHEGVAHAPIDEWREFVALREAHHMSVTAGGSELRRLAFPHAFSTANQMAAWLWNSRSEYALSHAISRWLLDEALAVGDAEAIEFGYRNCALAIPTRLGAVHDDPRIDSRATAPDRHGA